MTSFLRYQLLLIHKFFQVALDASNREKAIVDLLNTKQRLQASASGNVAAAEIADGQRAQVQRIGDKGGIATVDGHKWGS